MSSAQNGDEGLLDDLVLAEDRHADTGLGGPHMRPGGLGGPDDHVFQFFQAFAGRCRHETHSLLVIAQHPSPWVGAKSRPRGNERFVAVAAPALLYAFFALWLLF